jgi:hypothetical protein
VTRTERSPENSTEALLRAALLDDLEAVMSATDTERELRRFQSGVRRRSRRTQVVAAAAAVLVGVAALGAFLTVRGDDDEPSVAASSSDEVTGEMSLVIGGGGGTVDLPWGQDEYRGKVWAGEVTLDVGGPLHGTVRLVLDGSGVNASTTLGVFHGFGTAEAELAGQRCTGTVALSFYAEPHETGGALQLRCSDGSVLGLSLAVDEHERVGTARWGADISVDGGFYRAG